LRDHVHGRIYRITYPSRPLVSPAKIDGASIETLLENLKLPEYRSRYRTRRELRGRNAAEVASKLDQWLAALDKNDPQYEHHQLEGLWVSWGLNRVNQALLKQLLKAKDYRVRAAAVEVLRFTGHQVKDQAELLMQAARDENNRVRLGAIVAASRLSPVMGLPILEEAAKKPLDDWMVHAHETAVAHLNGRAVKKVKEVYSTTNLKGKDFELFNQGKMLYAKEGFCVTCHQADGKGLPASGFPTLSGTEWVTGSEERLIKIMLKGLMGPIVVEGKNYEGLVPMTPFEGMLNDEEVAAVATYIRNSFGNKASVVSPGKVKEVRAKLQGKKAFYQSKKLLKEHPLESKTGK
jgi:mono/diheme cytochrome c family protein